ncbi:uncharacterized protein LOC142985156 [Anticarsia gemmatalis]|uniref:uncharacterized protein LOC142985156 n=1 Tax=Anticarsia gemmatalis TaxID=129554 RepID=UPI003F758A2B
MTSRLHLLLAATCALALIQLASGEECSHVQWGAKQGTVHNLAPAVLTPGVAHWKVDVPSPCVTKINGLVASGCDYDKAPKLQFNDALSIDVQRTGDLLKSGSVKVTVYCD